MSKRQLELPNGRFRPRTAQWSWAALAWPGLVLLLSALAWLGAPFFTKQFAATAGLVALQILLAVALQRSLAFLPLGRAWSYRLGFLASAGLAALRWIALSFQVDSLFSPVYLLAGLSGALLGGLAATGLDDPLWENNSPPSDRVQLEVFRAHQHVRGHPALAPLSKRIFDAGFALLGLLLSAPVWLFSLFLIWFEDPGPLLFVKNSVGRGGRNFHQFKFRTMVYGAESATGPVLARVRDERVLRSGRFLRKTALDELPQLLNILKGEMSFVGPRPQRTVLVHSYLERIPGYAERHRVLPGLAGLAQVAGDYYLTPRQKLRFDRLYIDHTGLAFDLKLICLACLITFWCRWQSNWEGRLPRRLLHK
jgi:lipopolysaccharide/colanic/teichoic acid biosynthesis glycosyltransferase